MLAPMAWIMRVIVPASGSLSAIVSGIRSAPGPFRTMTNWPGRRTFAIRGASTTRRTTFGESCSRSTTGCMRPRWCWTVRPSSPRSPRSRYLPMAPCCGPKVTSTRGPDGDRLAAVAAPAPTAGRHCAAGGRRLLCGDGGGGGWTALDDVLPRRSGPGSRSGSGVRSRRRPRSRRSVTTRTSSPTRGPTPRCSPTTASSTPGTSPSGWSGCSTRSTACCSRPRAGRGGGSWP